MWQFTWCKIVRMLELEMDPAWFPACLPKHSTAPLDHKETKAVSNEVPLIMVTQWWHKFWDHPLHIKSIYVFKYLHRFFMDVSYVFYIISHLQRHPKAQKTAPSSSRWAVVAAGASRCAACGASCCAAAAAARGGACGDVRAVRWWTWANCGAGRSCEMVIFHGDLMV